MFHNASRFWLNYIYIALSTILILLFIPSSNAVTIMSVDFGSEWMKIAVVAVSISNPLDLL